MQITKLTSKKKKTNKEIKQLAQQVEELTAKWKRAVADYRNLEMRVAKEKKEWAQFGKQELLLAILEIFDDLERAVIHISDDGIKLIMDKFRQLLIGQGVEEIKIKDKFDPQFMECVELIPGKKEAIINIEQKGYLYNGRLLRPAKVKIGKGL